MACFDGLAVDLQLLFIRPRATGSGSAWVAVSAWGDERGAAHFSTQSFPPKLLGVPPYF